MSDDGGLAPAPLRVARQARAHGLRAPVRVRRDAARARRVALGAGLALGHGRDGRRTHARDGPEPADRRGGRRAQPAYGERASSPPGRSRRGQVAGSVRAGARRLPRRRLPARPGRALALADPGRVLRRLPVPQADHVALPPLARRHARACAGRGVGRCHRRVAVAGVDSRRRRRALGRRLRPLLLALRPRARPRAGPALVGDAVRRARRLAAARGASTLGTVALLAVAGPRPRRRAVLLARGRGGRRAARVRALARPPRRPAAARRRVLHGQRRDQHRLPLLRRSPTCSCDPRAGGSRSATATRRALRAARLRPRARRLPRRHRRERLRQDDAAPPRRGARGADARRARRRRRPRHRSAISVTSRSSTAI